jgi:hypothetical protein
MALGDPPKTEIRLPKMPHLPKIPAGGFRLILLGLLAVWLVFTSFYTIDPEEVGVELRFGQYTETTQPGLNFKLPLGIESVIKVPVQRQLKEEFGFSTVSAGVRSEFARTRETLEESNLLTGDLNSAVVEWVVQYRIVEPYKFLFRVRNVQETLRDMSEAVTARSTRSSPSAGRRWPTWSSRSCRPFATSTRPASRSTRWSCRTSTRRTGSSPRSTRSTRRSRSARS